VLGQPGLSGIPGTCRNCGANREYPATLELFETTPDYEEADRTSIVRSLEAATLGERTPA